jgi:hypothetical protein
MLCTRQLQLAACLLPLLHLGPHHWRALVGPAPNAAEHGWTQHRMQKGCFGSCHKCQWTMTSPMVWTKKQGWTHSFHPCILVHTIEELMLYRAQHSTVWHGTWGLSSAHHHKQWRVTYGCVINCNLLQFLHLCAHLRHDIATAASRVLSKTEQQPLPCLTCLHASPALQWPQQI